MCLESVDRIMRLVVAVLVLAACRPPGYGGDDDAPTIDAARPLIDAALDAPTTCEKLFRLDGYAGAATVWLTGSFTSWAGNPAAGAIELAKGGDGAWTVTRTLAAGAHQYKFIVDGGNWITDPANPNVVDDGTGHQNSAYTCAP
jgi:hypothetical protein